jgi:hypothetical protein
MMSWRPIRTSELEECLSLNPKSMGDELVGRARAVTAWQRLRKARSFRAVLIESDVPIRGHRIVGFAANVFVSASFAEREIADPKPGLNSRLISSIASGDAVVLTAEELAYENTQGSLHLIVAQPCSMPAVLTPEERQDVIRQISLANLSCFDGYRVRQVLMEATSADEIEIAKSFQVWKILSSLEDYHRRNPGNSWNRDRALFAIDLAGGHSFEVKAGHNREPILGLRNSDQELLEAALRATTDKELSVELGLKLPALKKRWASVFNRVAVAKPDLLPGLDDNLDRQTRGRQKKHRLLAYVREHPEELRPYLHPQPPQRGH